MSPFVGWRLTAQVILNVLRPNLQYLESIRADIELMRKPTEEEHEELDSLS